MISKQSIVLFKRLVIFSLVIIVVIAVTQLHLITTKAPLISGPKISFEHKAYDAGVVHGKKTTVIKHSFPFRNDGTELLQIDDIRTNCGCTVVDRRQRTLAPGDQDSLDVELTIGSVGKRASDILVFSNTASSPEKLTIAATFDPEAAANSDPEKLDLGEISSDFNSSESLAIHAFLKTVEQVKISHIESRLHLVEAQLLEAATSEYRNQFGYYRTDFKLAIRTHITNPGKFEDFLTITFEPSSIPPVEIPVTGEVMPKWVITPKEAIFIFQKQSESDIVTRTLLLCHSANKSLSCAKINNSFKSWLTVSVSPEKDETILKIQLQAIRPSNIDVINDHIELLVQTTDGMPEIVQIPFTLRVL